MGCFLGGFQPFSNGNTAFQLKKVKKKNIRINVLKKKRNGKYPYQRFEKKEKREVSVSTFSKKRET